MDSGRLQPALLGGVFIGVMSALPIVNAGNCCCCLWVLAGGVLAVYLRKQNSAVPITAAEGALVGLLAGVIGGVIGSVLNIPIQMVMGPMQAEWMSRIASARDRARKHGPKAQIAASGAPLGACVTVLARNKARPRMPPAPRGFARPFGSGADTFDGASDGAPLPRVFPEGKGGQAPAAFANNAGG